MGDTGFDQVFVEDEEEVTNAKVDVFEMGEARGVVVAGVGYD